MITSYPTLDAVVILHQKGVIRLMSSDLQQELSRCILQLHGREPFFMHVLPATDKDTHHFVVVTRGADGGAGLMRSRITRRGDAWSFARIRTIDFGAAAAGARIAACAALLLAGERVEERRRGRGSARSRAAVLDSLRGLDDAAARRLLGQVSLPGWAK